MNDIKPEDFTVSSANQSCTLRRFTDFVVPARIPKLAVHIRVAGKVSDSFSRGSALKGTPSSDYMKNLGIT